MIMPAVFAFHLDPSAGPGLTFMTMPVVFAQLPFGQLFAFAFYLCLAVAAITSSVSLLELVVAFLVDELKMRRMTASLVSCIAMLAVGSLCTLSFGPLADVKPLFERNFFDLFDYFTSNLSLPIGGLVICALVGIKRWSMMKDEIRMGSGVSDSMMSIFRGILTIGCPLLIVVVLISGLMPS